MKRRGFTLVELLVVISIIALLMAILMPALAQVRRLAQRIICGTHLSAIGKAMIVYAQDNEQDFPRSGGRLSKWTASGKITMWDAQGSGTQTPQEQAFGTDIKARATITSSFFLLIKYADGIPKIFNCSGDIGARVFELSDSQSTTLTDIKDAWDFGDGDDADGLLWPGQYVSYSYHMPFCWGTQNYCYALQSSDSAASPVCADRNPYLDINAREYIDGADPTEKQAMWDTTSGMIDTDNVRNSAAHQREGQNVLYIDAHVDFESSPNCGIQNDFIWMFWQKAYASMTAADKQWTQADCTELLKPQIVDTIQGPRHLEDAFLVNECNCRPSDY
jgi:prepilin-type N-terminal cleavage/methylation domain-containing protein